MGVGAHRRFAVWRPLHTAIAAMGDIEGAKMDALKAALKRALKDAVGSADPGKGRIHRKSSQEDRKFDEERAAEMWLEESERKLEELRALHKKQEVNGVRVAVADQGLSDRQEEMNRSCLWKSNGSGTLFWIDHRCDQESNRLRCLHPW